MPPRSTSPSPGHRCRAGFSSLRPGLLATLIGASLLMLLTGGCAITPQPLTQAELERQAARDMGALFQDQEPVGEQIDLYTAMARAIKYNLDHRVKQLEKALADESLAVARRDLLPRLVASAGYTARDNENGSVSQSLLTGAQSLEASTSQDKSLFTADLIQVWNVLDFGVSYTQAKQMADEVLIAEQWRRKAVQNIVQDVRYAFWRAASAEQLLPEMDALLGEVENALARARQMEKERAQPPIKMLAYQQGLLETVKQLWSMRKELALAKTELATLMNLWPGTDFTLAADDRRAANGPGFGLPAVEPLEEKALSGRPELVAESYQQRISRLEVRKTMLGMLPGLELNVGGYYDDNSFLYNNSWLQAGLNLSWNAFNLLSGPAALKRAEAQQSLAAERRMAVAMMVLAQVHLAHQRYALARKEYAIASDLRDIHQRRIWHLEAARRASTGNELQEIRQRAAALAAKMHEGVAFAELQAARGRIMQSAGIDPLPATVASYDIAFLGTTIKEREKALWDELEPAGPPLESGAPAQPPAAAVDMRPPAAAEQEPEPAMPPPSMAGPPPSPAPAGPEEESGAEPPPTATVSAPGRLPAAPPAAAEQAVSEETLAGGFQIRIRSGREETAMARPVPSSRTPAGITYRSGDH